MMTDTKNLVTSIVTRFLFVYIGTASGNRTRDSAVRGLRLNRLTNSPQSIQNRLAYISKYFIPRQELFQNL